MLNSKHHHRKSSSLDISTLKAKPRTRAVAAAVAATTLPGHAKKSSVSSINNSTENGDLAVHSNQQFLQNNNQNNNGIQQSHTNYAYPDHHVQPHHQITQSYQYQQNIVQDSRRNSIPPEMEYAKRQAMSNEYDNRINQIHRRQIPFGMPGRSHSVDIASKAQPSQYSQSTHPLASSMTQSDSSTSLIAKYSLSQITNATTIGTNNMRPKLKVQIPLGESSENQIGANDKSRTASEDNPSQPTSSASAKDETGSGSSNVGQITPLPLSAGGGVGGGTGSGSGSGSGTWGNSLLLPPPSPSSYLNASSSVGPGNPFGRPPLLSNNGEQTPLSAALPSKYVTDLLPSPSNFYGSEWSMHFGPFSGGGMVPPSMAGSSTATNSSIAVAAAASVIATSGTTGGGPTNSIAATTSHNSSILNGVGMGISLGGVLNSRAHLASEMLPSPLQFNTPVVASSSQSLGDQSFVRNSPNERKRETEGTGRLDAKRVKLGEENNDHHNNGGT